MIICKIFFLISLFLFLFCLLYLLNSIKHESFENMNQIKKKKPIFHYTMNKDIYLIYNYYKIITRSFFFIIIIYIMNYTINPFTKEKIEIKSKNGQRLLKLHANNTLKSNNNTLLSNLLKQN